MNSQGDSTAREKSEDNNKIDASIYFSFLVTGTLNMLLLLVLVSAAQDVLAGTTIQTSVVVLAWTGPYSLIVLLAPSFIKPIPYVARFMIVFVGVVLAFVVLGLTSTIKWKVLAVVLAGFTIGLSDLSIIGLTAYFSPSVLAAYSAGTGAGMFLAPLYYTAMTTWLCVSPNNTLLILAPMSLLFLLCFYLIKQDIKEDHSKGPGSRKEIVYSKIPTLEEHNQEDNQEVTKKKIEMQDRGEAFASRETLTWKEKLSAIKKVLVLIGVPVFIAWFSEYTCLQSIVTTIAYPNAPFSPRDHYEYYFLVLLFGEVLGRSHRSMIGAIYEKWLYVPTSKGLWVLSFVVVLHLVFVLLESWYRFLPGVGFLIFLCLTLGIIIGIMFANFLEVVRVNFEGKEREFVMSWVLNPSDFGMVAASLVSLFVEPRLREHCIAYVTDSAYCSTRTSNVKNIVVSCKATMS